MEGGEGGLLAKPGKDLLLPSSYTPISTLPALSKIWKHTFKVAIERNEGRGFWRLLPCGTVWIQRKEEHD